MPLELWTIVFLAMAIGVVAAGIWGIRASFRPVTVPRVRYTGGRHRAVGMSTSQQILAAAKARAVKAYAEAETLVSDLRPVADEPTYKPARSYVGYEMLAPKVLAAEARVDVLAARLRVRRPTYSAWGTPEDLDVWELPAGVEGHLIGARGAA